MTLRQALIEEEVGELQAAAGAGDLVGVADALADIVYVAYGTAHVYGIDLDAVLDEVHASNMTKLGADGRPVRRADGKILKGPGLPAARYRGRSGTAPVALNRAYPEGRYERVPWWNCRDTDEWTDSHVDERFALAQASDQR